MPASMKAVASLCILSLASQIVVPATAQSTQNDVAGAPATQTATTTTPATKSSEAIPFDLLQHASRNPIDAYRGKNVPPPNMANSVQLNSLVRDGKLYLSLHDAIDLALEDNLDMVIARYNLPIAQTDILRTAAGGQALGVNTGVVSGTPGGAGGGLGGGSGAGAGGTTSGAGGAGAGASGLVQNTIGTGTNVSNYDPSINVTTYIDHTTQQLPNQVLYGIPVIHLNEFLANASYVQAFPTGGSIQATWNNNRQTTNSPNNTFNPQLSSFVELYVQQQLLAGFGLGPNLRFLHIARTNQKVSDIAFRAQVIATVTQICNLYWDLVSAYDNEQVSERSVAFATETLNTSRQQLKLQAIPEMDVLKAEGELATRQQDLTVARTNLELQELYMKNAITRSLDDPILEEMPVVPTDHIGTQVEGTSEPVQDMIADALKNRTEVQENTLTMQNSELSRKTARNALLPSLSVYGFIDGQGYGGTTTPSTVAPGTPIPGPTGYGTALDNALNYTSPEYQVGFQLSIPLRNRIAKAAQYRTELEYRQTQVYQEELKKKIRIEVRSARFALEQGASRVDAARNAHDLAQKTLDIMQKEQKLGAGSNQQTLASEHDLALAESALVAAETSYEKARIEVRRATGTVLEEFGIAIEANRKGNLTGAVSRETTAPVPSGQQ
ncbi:TolC family protein [Acidicapsa ligni]|uniref:TolC family protein n=1 Tax=Acidicapsa ligni TaxID=542300 RepID=UPI0021E09615|nr:TolC family protein [Acidicapsa ligni]